MVLPLQTVFDAQLSEELQHVGVSPEENMQAGFIPVAVLVLPGGHLATEHIARLHDHGRVARIAEVFGAGETGKACSGDGDAHGKTKSQRQP